MRFSSLSSWPFASTKSRGGSPFRASYKDTLSLLEKEVGALGAKDTTVGICLSPADFRNDGWPRASARPAHPGVIVSFSTPKLGPLQIRCDWFLDFQFNLRAIAVHLEHLRLAGLYGVGTDGQQYQGWRALPAPGEVDGFTTAAEAAAWLQDVSGYAVSLPADPGLLQTAYRHAARKLHPNGGGTDEQFLRLTAAMEVIKMESIKVGR